MSFRDALVVLRPYPAATPDDALDRAVATAALVSTRASALACAVVPMVPRSVWGDFLIGVSAMVGEEKRKSAADVERLLGRFAERVAQTKTLALGECIAETGASPDVPAVLADHARLHDVSIVPLAEGDAVASFDAQWYVETILFGSGRPTLVVPQRAARPARLDTVIVAWDGSRTAARAVADALPVLQVAGQVRLLTVVGEKAIGSVPSADKLARHLELHGVRAAVDRVEAQGEAIGDLLRRHVEAQGGDLLVMGAYGRSRLREFILGGATQAMLAKPPVALFMSH